MVVWPSKTELSKIEEREMERERGRDRSEGEGEIDGAGGTSGPKVIRIFQ